MVDIARPAYGHYVKKQQRHSIEVGTSNSDRYLQSRTGNRRFWPLRVLKAIDIAKLKRDRPQLWGEAAHYQSQGESLVLDEHLWGAAAIEQEDRRVADPWEDILRNMPELVTYGYRKNGVWHEGTRTNIHHDGDEEKVVASHLLEYVLGIQPGNQTTQHPMRLSTVLKKLGWERAKNGYVSIPGIGREKGYYRKWKPKTDNSVSSRTHNTLAGTPGTDCHGGDRSTGGCARCQAPRVGRGNSILAENKVCHR
jgi:predicted P-loop ATPase